MATNFPTAPWPHTAGRSGVGPGHARAIRAARRWLAGWLALWLVLPVARASDAAWAEMAQADAAHGRRLMAQHQCSACHARRVGGDGSAIYKPAGRINKPAALLAMVEMCNTELNLQLFPDDVAAIAAALNQAHYRFAAPAKP